MTQVVHPMDINNSLAQYVERALEEEILFYIYGAEDTIVILKLHFLSF
jgi:hypothetical protein